ncbi:hypothetical protein CBR_g3183 [Chara braunii]|uniref:Uncharacterized protein n=1 Tax=Chara braunii TaxID=69332 RepID=A0A388KF03_CHABU|nr:hypothetical protein CBR_g3183 [Chara braunii]|eukprot:GBG68642.1 hypothetical protein CBR_g3183 [Chara braunii]
MFTGAEVRKGALLWQRAHDGQSRAAGCRRGDGDGGLQVGGACSGESRVLRGGARHVLGVCWRSALANDVTYIGLQLRRVPVG